MRHWGYPHYFVSISEEENYFLAKEEGRYGWRRPWEKDDDKAWEKFINKGDNYELFRGQHFSSGELNTQKEARAYIKKHIKIYSDKTKYKITYDDFGTSDIFYSKDGD